MRLRYLTSAALVFPILAFGAEAVSAPATTTLVLDSNLVTLLKVAIWVGGGFLAVIAIIGVSFFGWDVKNARASILTIQKETKDLQLEAIATIEKLKAESEKIKAEIDKLQQVGAQLEEESDLHPDSNFAHWKSYDIRASGESNMIHIGPSAKTGGRSASPVNKQAGMADPTTSAEKRPDPPSTNPTAPFRSKIELIRDAISNSKYEWTSIGRVINKTMLSREEVIDEVRQAPDIKIGRGRNSKDFIFKIEKTT